MADENTAYWEHVAVEVKNKGPCPHPRGHAISAVIASIILTAFLVFFGTSAFFIVNSDTLELRREAVKRGYAAYTPDTGKWQWR